MRIQSVSSIGSNYNILNSKNNAAQKNSSNSVNFTGLIYPIFTNPIEVKTYASFVKAGGELNFDEARAFGLGYRGDLTVYCGPIALVGTYRDGIKEQVTLKSKIDGEEESCTFNKTRFEKLKNGAMNIYYQSPEDPDVKFHENYDSEGKLCQVEFSKQEKGDTASFLLTFDETGTRLISNRSELHHGYRLKMSKETEYKDGIRYAVTYQGDDLKDREVQCESLIRYFDEKGKKVVQQVEMKPVFTKEGEKEPYATAEQRVTAYGENGPMTADYGFNEKKPQGAVQASCYTRRPDSTRVIMDDFSVGYYDKDTDTAYAVETFEDPKISAIGMPSRIVNHETKETHTILPRNFNKIMLVETRNETGNVIGYKFFSKIKGSDDYELIELNKVTNGVTRYSEKYKGNQKIVNHYSSTGRTISTEVYIDGVLQSK